MRRKLISKGDTQDTPPNDAMGDTQDTPPNDAMGDTQDTPPNDAVIAISRLARAQKARRTFSLNRLLLLPNTVMLLLV